MKITVKQLRALISECLNESEESDARARAARDALANEPWEPQTRTGTGTETKYNADENVRLLKDWAKKNNLHFESPSVPIDGEPGEQNAVGLWHDEFEMIHLQNKKDYFVFVDLFNGQEMTKMPIKELLTKTIKIDDLNPEINSLV